MMSRSTVWLLVRQGQILLSSSGSFEHTTQPQNAAVFLPVSSSSQKQWVLAVLPREADDSDYERVGLRQLLNDIDEPTFARLSRASQLEYWWQEHQYCGRCGQRQHLHATEQALTCLPCNTLIFPRISPCMIVLVKKGRQLLLAKHARSRSNRYSCLAGYVEAGENVEQTVAREVKEEVGLTITGVQYQASQNWPFPSQLMLGFWADYAGGDIQVDGVEIEDAAWFDYEDLPQIPPDGSIAHTLIQQYINHLNAQIQKP